MKKLITLTLCTIVSTGVFAKDKYEPAHHAKVPDINHLDYAKARNLLIKNGWKPVEITDPDVTKGEFPEQDCGASTCISNFTDKYGSKLVADFPDTWGDVTFFCN